MKRKMTKLAITLVMAISLLLSPAMALAENTDSQKLDYLALGDSLAAGRTPFGQHDKGYTDFIAGQLNKMNKLASFEKRFAVSGYTTSDILHDIQTNVEKEDSAGQTLAIKDAIQNAEMITLDAGANDVLQQIQFNETTGEAVFDQQALVAALNGVKENLVTILTEIKSLNPSADIYIMGYYNPLPYLPQQTQSQLLPLLTILNSTISGAGQAFSVKFVPTADAMASAVAQNPGDYLPNPKDIHPSEAGYLVLANEFWKTINVKNKIQFTDEIQDWAKDEVNFLVEKGIINGFENGKFGADEPIKRLHSAIMLDRAIVYNEQPAANPGYIDVIDTSDGYSIVAKLTEQGIFAGDNQYFYPNQSLTRAQMAKILVTAFHLQGSAAHSFTDVNTTHWASDYISILSDKKIINGYADGSFKPDQSITRAEFSVMLSRVINKSFIE
ncbi:S-layer homology domain-containing protein [Niallia oryzisoli]|uniref:S-layer homology domain-containing protein n=1 Tax=Niallia oryzisoli TaxID=1737571 RepID=UPI003734C624